MDTFENLNIEFVRNTQTSITYAIMVLLGLGILLDVVTFVFRKYANLILYYEILFVVLMGFIPFDYGEVAMML